MYLLFSGLSAWDTEEAILATVLAQSQQEYLDVLRQPSSHREEEEEDEDSSWPSTSQTPLNHSNKQTYRIGQLVFSVENSRSVFPYYLP